jgi:predicted nucleic acid-binding protein
MSAGTKLGNESKPKVYVETSVSSYLAARPSRDPIAAGRQAITKRWWELERKKYSLWISELVLTECGRGERSMAEVRHTLISEISLFPVNQGIIELAQWLIAPGAIPAKAAPDAIHIAAAAVEQCDYLLTWNFRHIANSRIRREVERILATHGYAKTTICTPEELV